jgi:hypothetical protein
LKEHAVDYRRIATIVVVVILIIIVGYFMLPVLLGFLMDALLETLR